MVYKDSDYTIVIAVMRRPKRTFSVLKLTSVPELWVLRSFHWQLSGKAHKDSDYTAMITIVHQRLCAETHPVSKVVSAVTRSAFLKAAIARSTWTASHGRQVACVLIRKNHKLAATIIWAAFEGGLSV